MGKSNEKSYREARKERLSKEQKNSKKRNPKGVRRKKIKKGIIWSIVIVLIALLITGIVLVKTGFVHRRVTAFEVGGEKFTIADYNYWYQMLAAQMASSTYSYPDRETVISNVYSIIGVAKAAEAMGYTLNEEEVKTYDSTLQQLRSELAAFDGSEKEFFNQNYGVATNEEIVMKNYKYQLLAIQYYNEFCEGLDYTDEDFENYYKEHGKENLASLDFRVCIFSTDDGNTFAIPYESNEAARAAADKLNSVITDEESFINAVKSEAESLGYDMTKFDKDETLEEDFIYSNINSQLEEVRDWLFSDDRKANDHTVITATVDGKEVSYLLFIVDPLSREDYKTVDMRHILISTQDESSSLSEEELDEQAKAKIEQICAEWEDSDMTDEKFAELAKKYSADSTAEDGGIIEKIYKGQLVEEIEEFLFDAERKIGDYKIIKSTYGYHLVYYKGTNIEKWKIDAESLLITQDFEAETKKICDENGVTMERSDRLIDVFATEQVNEAVYY